MTIGKSSFITGLTTYAQKWKRAEIYKLKSAEGLQAKNKNMIVAPHHPRVNIGVVLIHQYYQQIIRWQEQQLRCCINKIGKTTYTSVRARTTNILVYSWRKIQIASWVATTWQASKYHVPFRFVSSPPILYNIKKIFNGRVPCKDCPKLD